MEKNICKGNWTIEVLKWSDKFNLELPRTESELLVLENITADFFGDCSFPNRDFAINLVEEGLKDMVTYIPEEIGCLKSLRKLSFFYNGISELPESIGELRNLKILELGDGGISELPKSFKNLTSLEVLDLSANNFTEIPKEIISLKNLKEFYIE
jgi:hypothetical protein